ncbi:MAG TPA: hypothetical protein VM734_12465 [Kofleriaceae bacterium]|nr:hypothetical protein [Kofleriaceae bacterium]
MTRRRARVAVLVALAVAACGGGGGGGGNDERLRRSKDAGAGVQVIDRAGSAAADRPAEREPNDDPAGAGPLGDGVRGSLDGETDVDAFTIASTGPQVLTARVTGVADVDLELELRDAKFALVVQADRAGNGAGEGLVGVPLDEGTYHLVVREVPKKKPKPKKGAKVDAGAGRVGPSAVYELTAELAAAPPAGVEREPNDDAGTANDLTLTEPATGYIGWSGDVDAWKLGVDAFAEGNGLDIAVTAVEGVALTVTVTDAGGRTLMKGQGKAGEPVLLKSLAPRVAPGGAPVHFILIAGRPSSHETPYTVTVTSRLLDLDEEAEPNDRTTNATPLRFGGEEQGSMRGLIGPGDTDVFALSEATAAATLDVAVDAPPGVDLVVEAIASNGASLGKADGATAGGAETLAALPVAAGAAVFVKVTAKADKKATAGPYQLRWSLTAGAPARTAGPGDDDPMPDEDPLPPEE